jgi:hypothetical protein
MSVNVLSQLDGILYRFCISRMKVQAIQKMFHAYME